MRDSGGLLNPSIVLRIVAGQIYNILMSSETEAPLVDKNEYYGFKILSV